MQCLRLGKRESGVAVIELALSLPLLIIFLVMVLFYGYAFLLVRASESAASVGAQAAVAQSPLGTNDGGSYAPDEAAVAAAKKALDNRFSSATQGGQACIAALQPVVTPTFVFSVEVNFDNCEFLELLRIDLPMIGKLPPKLGTYRAQAKVQL